MSAIEVALANVVRGGEVVGLADERKLETTQTREIAVEDERLQLKRLVVPVTTPEIGDEVTAIACFAIYPFTRGVCRIPREHPEAGDELVELRHVALVEGIEEAANKLVDLRVATIGIQ